jgi:small GTP-binding protein
MEKNEFVFKIILVGEPGVGKTALIQRFATDSFSTTHTVTLGIDMLTKRMQVDSMWVRLQLYDTAGQELYFSLIKSFYRKINAVVFVYNISDRRTFDQLSRWVEEVEGCTGQGVVKLLVGAQADRA